MHSKTLVPALSLFTLFALACGGGEVSTSDGVAVSPGSEGAASSAPSASGDIGSWSDPMSEVNSRLSAQGWSVSSCDMYTDDGDTYYDCEAAKGEAYAEVEMADFSSRDDAKWFVEDEAAAVRDGKRGMLVTVYDGGAGEALGDSMLPAGSPVRGLDRSKLEAGFKAQGYTITESSSSSSSSSDGYQTIDVYGTKSGVNASVTLEYPTKGKGGAEDRETDEGLFMVFQGDEDSLVVLVDDEGQAKELLKVLTAG